MTNSQAQRDSAVMMSSAMPSAKYSWSGSSLMLSNGSTAIDGLSGNGERRRLRVGIESQPIDADRLGDVLELLLTGVFERGVDLAFDLPVGVLGHRHAARLGDRFDPRRDVDAVAEQVAFVGDHVADVDADPECDAPVGRTRSAPRCAMPR